MEDGTADAPDAPDDPLDALHPDAVAPQVMRLLRLPPRPAQGTEAWLRDREGMLTASDVPTALGDNPYQTRASLLRRKLGLEPPFEGNFFTRWGHEFEPVAVRAYEDATCEACLEFGLIGHPTIPWLGGSPDRVTVTGRLVEVKCPFRREIRHECPGHYYGQVQILLECLDLEVCDFVQYKPAMKGNGAVLDILEIPRDRAWFAEWAFPKLRAFWEELLEMRRTGATPPEPARRPRKAARTARQGSPSLASWPEEEAAGAEGCLFPNPSASAPEAECQNANEANRANEHESSTPHDLAVASGPSHASSSSSELSETQSASARPAGS